MGTRQTEVGRTGARFGSVGARNTGKHNATQNRSARPAEAPEPAAVEDGQVAENPDPASGLTGARFGPHSERHHRRPEPPPPPDPYPQPVRTVRRPWEEQPRVEPLLSESDVLIRPYARTGGRTRPMHDLALESLISTTPNAAQPSTRHRSWEHRRIASLCIHPRSVAEVAALLAIPLGVARILLVDMATDGTVVVHGGGGHRAPDLVLMNRVLAGLRRL
jgi:hypothetical protein